MANATFPKPKKVVLTESQKFTLSFAVRIAAERFHADAEVCRQEPGHERLARQFDDQEREARQLVDLIEDADTVTLDGGSQ